MTELEALKAALDEWIAAAYIVRRNHVLTAGEIQVVLARAAELRAGKCTHATKANKDSTKWFCTCGKEFSSLQTWRAHINDQIHPLNG